MPTSWVIGQGQRSRESMDFLGTSAQDVVELRAGTSIDLTKSQQLSKVSKFTAHNANETRLDPVVTCFVCGSVGRFQLTSIQVRQNPARPAEPYFPFLTSHHEPPHGCQPISPSQSKVEACSMCYQLLHEQWWVECVFWICHFNTSSIWFDGCFFVGYF